MVEREAITADYAPGTVETVTQHDGSVLRLRKLATDYDPHDRISALTYLQQRHAAGEVVTGLLFVEADHGDLHAFLDTVETPLNALGEAELCPPHRRARPLQRRASLSRAMAVVRAVGLRPAMRPGRTQLLSGVRQ